MLELTQPFYDVDLSVTKYENWKNTLFSRNAISIIRPDVSRETLVYIILANDVSAPYYKVTQLRKLKKDELLSLYLDLINNGLSSCATKQELIDELLKVSIHDYYTFKAKSTLFNVLDCDYTVNGNDQNDIVKVKIINKELNWNTKEYLENLFYNIPITSSIEIENGEIVYLSSLLKSEYHWDKNEIMAKLKKEHTDYGISPEAMAYLENNLADNPV